MRATTPSTSTACTAPPISTSLRSEYDRIAPVYDVGVGEDDGLRVSAAVAEVARRLIEPDARVLDAGAGTGLLGVELARAGFRRLDGLDMSSGMLGRGRAQGRLPRRASRNARRRARLRDRLVRRSRVGGRPHRRSRTGDEPRRARPRYTTAAGTSSSRSGPTLRFRGSTTRSPSWSGRGGGRSSTRATSSRRCRRASRTCSFASGRSACWSRSRRLGRAARPSPRGCARAPRRSRSPARGSS